MRILTWNINGVRTLPQYHPWFTLKTLEAMLEHPDIKADIFCFQEMKIARSLIDRSIALPGPYDAFFSLPLGKGKGGYSGVAVYTDSRTVRPLKAEEGLSGLLQPKPPLAPEERVSPSYPGAHNLDFMPDEHDHVPTDLMEIDNEGRALVLDFGLFVLLNLYCPAETVETRLPFKMNFHYMLRERVRKLTEEEGREVIVVGDINICSQLADHCDGALESKRREFWNHPARIWFRDWLQPVGKLIDLTRRFWPDRQGLYTCWNTLISARASNYGTRVDYMLCTPGLLPWVKFSDIMPSVQGSDHCPVYLDLHDEIVSSDGKVRRLRDELHFQDAGAGELPRIAAKYWDEFSGRQSLLSNFFGKKAEGATGSTQTCEENGASSHADVVPTYLPPSPPIDTPPLPASLPSSATVTAVIPPAISPLQPVAGPSTSRTATKSSSQAKAKPAKKKGQMKLSSFFGPPSTPAAPPSTKAAKKAQSSQSSASRTPSQPDVDDEAAEERYWTEILSQSSGASTSSKAAWSDLLTAPTAPNCSVHGVPAKEWTVNKPGPNKGKRFYLCSKPPGPGYDSGRSKRLREEVDPQYRCDFFQWASDVKKAAKKSDGEPSAKRQRQ